MIPKSSGLRESPSCASRFRIVALWWKSSPSIVPFSVAASIEPRENRFHLIPPGRSASVLLRPRLYGDAESRSVCCAREKDTQQNRAIMSKEISVICFTPLVALDFEVRRGSLLATRLLRHLLTSAQGSPFHLKVRLEYHKFRNKSADDV